ncbi:MAG TPA: HEAT repeat domain-containing protein [Planctomycetaceae bacterium]|jgi:putative membrane-bound dehydrogenase-like protein
MLRCALVGLCLFVAGGSWTEALFAQQKVDARWVWFDEGNPAENAPAGKVWFRKEYRAEEPSTGAAVVACDDEFILWVNGQKVGQGGGDKSSFFNLNGIVGRGTNVFAVEATNASGKAGLFIDAEIRGQGGHRVPCDTNAEWKATRQAPQRDAWLKAHFDDSQWKPVKVIGRHADSPWKEISFDVGDVARFQLPPGFEIKRIADKELVGSLVAITWGNRGRLIACAERRSIISVIDEDGDGTFDKTIEFTNKLKNCQGMCMVNDTLYVVGDGPDGAGLYLLPDRDHDDKADEVILLNKPKGGMGEHGPHNVVFGPDGWLYHNLGNHAWITNTPEANTPCRNWEEGNLLDPAFEDAGGHAVGIKAPGGSIWRFSPDGKKWWAETTGFRNQYDICFNQHGDLFTFDSDMEWDVNLPWYRPVRINHCIPGAEFGWRSGSKLWPDYFFDSLPTTVDVGRGSPTGVVFYEHSQFPEKYRGAMLNCDWSMGRIIVSYLERDGATYKGKWDNLVTGNPLNVSDIEVDRDGSVVFCTGGRGTEGGLYRVTYTGGTANTPKAPAADTLDDALALPQPQAAWSRELAAGIKENLGDQWAPGLQGKVKSGTPAQKVRALSLLAQQGPKPEPQLLVEAAGDADAGVRQFAVLLLGDHATPEVAATLTKLLADTNPTVARRACEAFVRAGLEAPVEPILRLLDSRDRWLQFAARIAIERIPVQSWKEKVLGRWTQNSQSRLVGLLALHRLGTTAISPEETFAALNQIEWKTILATGQVRMLAASEWTRMLELTLIRGGVEVATPQSKAELAHAFSSQVAEAVNSRQWAKMDVAGATPVGARGELARIVAVLQAPDAVPTCMKVLINSTSPQEQIHYAMCLRYAKEGWTFDLKKSYLDWYETTKELEGGNSLQGYLRNIVTGTLDYYTPEDRKQFILAWKERPHATRVVISASQPEHVKDFDQVVVMLLADLDQQPAGGGSEMLALAVDALGKSAAAESQAVLRRLFDENADRRDLLARAIAKHPIVENIPYLERSVASADNTTKQVCIAALTAADYKPVKPEEYRTVIIAGLKLGKDGGKAVVGLLKKWSGSNHPKGDDIAAALAHYQQWFRETYPEEPAPELAQADTDKTKYSVDQLVEFLDKNPAGAKGDAGRGREVFAKANCLKCHRFLKEGEGVGPDLTTIRRRFQKKEIIESVLLPSQVISDQYTAVTVETKEGQVYTGMPLPNPGSKNLLLLLSDATKLEIAPDKIEDKVKAKVSVMPEGLFKDLSLEQIADLFAFLETSKNNPDPAPPAAAK